MLKGILVTFGLRNQKNKLLKLGSCFQNFARVAVELGKYVGGLLFEIKDYLSVPAWEENLVRLKIEGVKT